MPQLTAWREFPGHNIGREKGGRGLQFPYAEKRELEDREAEVARAPRTENQRRGRPVKRELQRSSVPLESSAEYRSEHVCKKTTQGWGNNQPKIAGGKPPKLTPSQN